jgi:5-methylcytosine-specific restriction endonuclease McrA
MGWYEDRFSPHPARIECACLQCDRKYWLPPCEVSRRKTCGKECRLVLGAQQKKARARDCLHCGAGFVPRTTQIDAGQGKYCSTRCATVGNGQLWTPAAVAAKTEVLRLGYADGTYKAPSGPDHVQWTGGPNAARARRVASGKAAAQTRSYRKRFPEKVREFAKRRKGRSLGSLPRGTVKRIGELQRWKCTACGTSLKSGYHVDHVLSLMAGGEHKPSNLQLLCPTCNVKKWAKHPIDFMQERGFLL